MLSDPSTALAFRKPVVVVLSLDGMRYDYPDRVAGGAFSRLEREGVRADRLEPPFPASTFPAHATLATGCYPERHGILNSRFLDRARGEFDLSNDPSWIKCEPLWVTAERHGVRTAVSNWIGSYGPWGGIEASYHDRSFVRRPDGESIRKVVNWLRLPEESRPGLILAYLSGVDHAGHRYGPSAPELTGRIRAEDRVLSVLLDTLESLPDSKRLTLVVLADHGMTERRAAADPMAVLSRHGIRNRTYVSGGCANVYLARQVERERARILLARIPGLEVFPGETLPLDLHYRSPGRTGDLVLLASEGVELGHGDSGEPTLRGVHGYRGSEETMGGIFYAWGNGVRRGRRAGTILSVDVVPLVCRLLRIPPSSRVQGKVPPGVLTTP